MQNSNFFRSSELRYLRGWFKNIRLQDKRFVRNVSRVYSTNVQEDKFFHCYESGCLVTDKKTVAMVFNGWKLYAAHKLHRRKTVCKARSLYYKKLKERTFNALSMNVLLKWQSIAAPTYELPTNGTFIHPDFRDRNSFYSKTLLTKYFEHWKNYVAMKEKEVAENTRIFYASLSLRKCLNAWKLYLKKRRQLNAARNKISEACKYYRSALLRKCIQTWINFHTCLRIKEQNALEHYRKQVLKKYYNVWTEHWTRKIEKFRTSERIEEYNRKRLSKLCLRKFVLYIAYVKSKRISREKAEEFFKNRLLQKVLLAWKLWRLKRIEDLESIEKIKCLLRDKTRRTVFCHWKFYVFRKKRNRKNTFLSTNLRRKRLMLKAFAKLRNYVEYRKNKKNRLSYLDEATARVQDVIMKIYLEKWRKALCDRTQEKCRLNRALEHFEAKLLRHYLNRWRIYSKNYKTKARRKRELRELASNFVLKESLALWRTKCEEISREREKERLAIFASERKILARCFAFWKLYHNERREERLEIEAAKDYHRKLLIKEGLKRILRNSLRDVDRKCEIRLNELGAKLLENLEVMGFYFRKWRLGVGFERESKLICDKREERSFKTEFLRNLDSECSIINGTRLVLPEYMRNNDFNKSQQARNILDYSQDTSNASSENNVLSIPRDFFTDSLPLGRKSQMEKSTVHFLNSPVIEDSNIIHKKDYDTSQISFHSENKCLSRYNYKNNVQNMLFYNNFLKNIARKPCESIKQNSCMEEAPVCNEVLSRRKVEASHTDVTLLPPSAFYLKK